MNKNLLIFFRANKFRKNDEIRFEVKNYNSSFDVNFVEIYDYLYDKKLFKNTNKLSKPIKSLSTYNQIEKYFLLAKKKYKNIYLINFIPIENFKSFKINYLIYKILRNNFKIIIINNSGFPSKMIDNFDKILFLNFRFNEIIKKIKIKIFQKIFSFFNFYPDFFLYAGSKKKKIFKDIKFTKLIKFNTWDYSNILHYKKKIKLKNYFVFVDGAGPKDFSDRELLGKKHYLTSDVWYKDLKFFLFHLKKIYNLDLIILNHPFSSKKKVQKYYKGIKNFSNKTQELIKNSKFVVTRQSTAISYALYYRKPILLIYSNQNKNDYYDINISSKLSKLLKLNSFNINDLKKKSFIDNFMKINLNLYNKYIFNYLSERKNKLSNSDILNNIVINNDE
jgi:hypothetical protein